MTRNFGKVFAIFRKFLATMCMHKSSFFFWLAAPRAPPQSVRVMALNSTAIEITWLPPPDNTLRGAIHFYIVNGTEAVTMDTTYYQEVNTTRAMFSGLHPYYFYWFSVAAVANDRGSFSERVGNYTEEDGKIMCTAGHFIILVGAYISGS